MIKVEFNEIYSSMSLSGHMYRNSPYETDNSCGNCDGARCDNCHKVYSLYNSVTENEIPLYIDDKQIYTLRELTNKDDYHYGYYQLDFKYEDIENSDDVKLRKLMDKEFIDVNDIDNKLEKYITYHIILSNDDEDMEEYINRELEKADIKSFKLIRIISGNEE